MWTFALNIMCAATWMSTAAPAAVDPRITITVRIYQTAGLASALERRALAETETVLLAGGVAVHWRQCSGLMASPSCVEPPGPTELLLVVRDASSCEDAPGTLGEALIDRRTGGVLATVYANCVGWLASATHTDVAVLLGRVAAHELAHLMMRTSAHARRGLMRRNWTQDEVRRNRAADWAFTAADAAALRQPGTSMSGY